MYLKNFAYKQTITLYFIKFLQFINHKKNFWFKKVVEKSG